MSKSASVVQEPDWRDYLSGRLKPEYTGPEKVRVIIRSWTKEFGKPRAIASEARPDKGPFDTYTYSRIGPITQAELDVQAQQACHALNHEKQWALERRADKIASEVVESLKENAA